MKISEFQLMMRNIYFHRDAERGVGPTFAWLVEEVGELGRALMSRDVNVDHVREEFADVMAWLTSAANVAGIDLEQATLMKYDGKCPRCRELRCGCPMRLKVHGVVAEARGSMFRRKDGRYFIYLPKELVEDSGFPFPCDSSLPVTIHFRPGELKLIVEKTEKPQPNNR